jgi:8-oxo-dGTP pyrophosphatase MutT (NUDIX family)
MQQWLRRKPDMPLSDYLHRLRSRIGHDLLLLPSAAVAIHDQDKRILLGLHSDRNIWVLPGGLVEPGELPADAAIRETWEETALRVELTGILGVYGGPDLIVNYANGDRASYVATVFRGHVVGGELRPDGTEIIELRYFSADELRGIRHPAWVRHASAAIFSDRTAADFQLPSWRP